MLSPILSFSMQKLVFKAFPISLPPFSSIEQLKTSSSTSDMFSLINSAIALAPTSPKTLFLNLMILSELFFYFSISHMLATLYPSSWQSATFRFSMKTLALKTGSKIMKFFLPISFSLISSDLIRSVFIKA